MKPYLVWILLIKLFECGAETTETFVGLNIPASQEKSVDGTVFTINHRGQINLQVQLGKNELNLFPYNSTIEIENSTEVQLHWANNSSEAYKIITNTFVKNLSSCQEQIANTIKSITPINLFYFNVHYKDIPGDNGSTSFQYTVTGNEKDIYILYEYQAINYRNSASYPAAGYQASWNGRTVFYELPESRKSNFKDIATKSNCQEKGKYAYALVAEKSSVRQLISSSQISVSPTSISYVPSSIFVHSMTENSTRTTALINQTPILESASKISFSTVTASRNTGTINFSNSLVPSFIEPTTSTDSLINKASSVTSSNDWSSATATINTSQRNNMKTSKLISASLSIEKDTATVGLLLSSHQYSAFENSSPISKTLDATSNVASLLNSKLSVTSSNPSTTQTASTETVSSQSGTTNVVATTETIINITPSATHTEGINSPSHDYQSVTKMTGSSSSIFNGTIQSESNSTRLSDVSSVVDTISTISMVYTERKSSISFVPSSFATLSTVLRSSTSSTVEQLRSSDSSIGTHLASQALGTENRVSSSLDKTHQSKSTTQLITPVKVSPSFTFTSQQATSTATATFFTNTRSENTYSPSLQLEPTTLTSTATRTLISTSTSYTSQRIISSTSSSSIMYPTSNLSLTQILKSSFVTPRQSQTSTPILPSQNSETIDGRTNSVSKSVNKSVDTFSSSGSIIKTSVSNYIGTTSVSYIGSLLPSSIQYKPSSTAQQISVGNSKMASPSSLLPSSSSISVFQPVGEWGSWQIVSECMDVGGNKLRSFKRSCQNQESSTLPETCMGSNSKSEKCTVVKTVTRSTKAKVQGMITLINLSLNGKTLTNEKLALILKEKNETYVKLKTETKERLLKLHRSRNQNVQDIIIQKLSVGTLITDYIIVLKVNGGSPSLKDLNPITTDTTFYGTGSEFQAQTSPSLVSVSDYDECQDVDACARDAYCIKTPGDIAYACQCKSGYKGNGFSCKKESSTTTSTRQIVIIIVAVSVCSIIVIIFLGICFYKHRLKQQKQKKRRKRYNGTIQFDAIRKEIDMRTNKELINMARKDSREGRPNVHSRI